MLYLNRRFLLTIAFTLSFSVLIFAQTESVTNASSSTSSSDEMAIRLVITKFFTAYQKKDIAAIASLWSAKSPDFASGKQQLEKLFAENENIAVKNVSFLRTEIKGEKANARVIVEIGATDANANKPSQAFGSKNRFLNLVKEDGNWKIFGEISAEDELASRLLEAKSEEEINQLLKENKDLINIHLAIALRGKGIRLFGKNALSQVYRAYSLGLKIAEQIGDKTEMSYALNLIGNTLTDMGKMPEALEAFQKTLKISEENGDKNTTAMVLGNIGRLYLMRDEFEKALDYLQKSYKLAEEVGNKRLMANALGNSGAILVQQSNYAKSLEYQQKALRLREEIGDKIAISAVMSHIGLIYAYQNDYNKALEYWEKAVKLRETADGKTNNKQDQSLDLMNIGSVYDLRGDKAKALFFFQKSLNLSEEIGFPYGIAGVSVNIGSIYYSQANYEQAVLYYKKALAIAESIGNKYNIITASNGISYALHSQGKFPEALEYSKKALALAEEIGNKAEITRNLMKVGSIYRSLNDSTLALDYFQKALKQSEEISENLQALYALIAIAKMQISKGDFAEALKTTERAKSFYERITGLAEDWDLYATIAKAHRGLSQSDKARLSLDKAVNTVESIRNNAVGSEEDQQRFFGRMITPYHLMIDLLISENNSSEAFSFAERAKSRTLLDVLQNGKIDITKVMTAQERERETLFKNELVSLQTQISKESRKRESDKNRISDLQNQLEKKRLEFEDFQTRLYAAHPELKIQRGEMKPISLAETAELIPDDKTALLEFVVAEDKAFLFVITKTANQSTVSLNVYPIEIKQKDLASRVELFRSKLAKADLDFSQQAKDLFDLLLKPAAKELQGKTNWIIVPDADLWNLPFQALKSAQNKYLIEQTAVSYAPSLTALRETTRIRKLKANKSAPTELLAFGNPIIGKETKARVKQVFMSENLEPIPEAERLVNSLERLYGTNKSKVFVGAEASEDKAKAESSKYRILQFATHGILNDASPMYSHLVLSEKSTTDRNEDGLLEAWEMKDLDLNADMVILSACETARGKLSAGEGVIGMSWALFIAGAPTTVVSQWKVESSSTTELMLEFHRQLLTGKNITKAEALRRASLKLLKNAQYKHPSYWAPFVIVGDGF